jgi:hypothetical protein
VPTTKDGFAALAAPALARPPKTTPLPKVNT